MTHLLSSQWINAWLNVLSTILLAGKKELFEKKKEKQFTP